MQRIQSGAYLTEDFSQGLNEEIWQVERQDSAMKVEVEDGSLRLRGRARSITHAMTGLATRRFFPPDVALLAEMRVPTDMNQIGTFGFGVHLASPMVRSDAHGLQTDSDVLFGRYAGQVGWFTGWFDLLRDAFFGGSSMDTRVPPFGDEATEYRTIRITYSEPARRLEVSLYNRGEWIEIGATTRSLKMFVSVELKMEAQAAGLDLETQFRNVRLFPNPARHPLRVLVPASAGQIGATALLTDTDSERVIAEGIIGSDRMAYLPLPTDAVFPLAGHLRLTRDGKMLDSLRIRAVGTQGIYPDDLYQAMTGIFHI